jgi:hypothetical protein
MVDPIIFLDFDGVLNCDAFFKSQQRSPIRTPDERDSNMLEERAVLLLKELVMRAQAQVVISSTWRLTRPLAKIRELLHEKGFHGRIIGKTPYLNRPRGDEIQAFLDSMADQPRSIVIIDDSADMVHLTPWLVRTTYLTGLQPEHVDQALKVLSQPAPMDLIGRLHN